jgi:hypothetical protein
MFIQRHTYVSKGVVLKLRNSAYELIFARFCLSWRRTGIEASIFNAHFSLSANTLRHTTFVLLLFLLH